MTEPIVSIIIATYNHGKYLSETMQSVLSQTYKKFEVIVVDDGSTDNTREIVKHYPVKYIYQENHGSPNAFNVGIRNSHGEFYITVGADDKLHPEYIRLCLKEMLRDDRIAFVWTGAQEFGASDNVLTPVLLRSCFSIYAGTGGQLGASLFRRKAYDEIGGYDETLPFYEDWDLAIRLVKRGWKGTPILEPIYFWRRHEKSRNKQAAPSVLRRVLEYKYPRMKLYMKLAKYVDFFMFSLSNPKESIRRLSEKTRKRM